MPFDNAKGIIIALNDGVNRSLTIHLRMGYPVAVDSSVWSRITTPGAPITDKDANLGIEQYNYFKNYFQGEDRKRIEETLQLAKEGIETLLKELVKMGFEPLDVYLRLETKYKATALILVNEEAFFSDDFEAAYSAARSVRDHSKSDYFDLHFSFAAKTDDTFEGHIACSGFYLKRKEVNEQSRSTSPRES
jgi:hypothetical protein